MALNGGLNNMKRFLLLVLMLVSARCLATYDPNFLTPPSNGAGLTNVQSGNVVTPVTNFVYDISVAYVAGLTTIVDANSVTINAAAANGTYTRDTSSTGQLVLTNNANGLYKFFWSTNYGLNILFTNLDDSVNRWADETTTQITNGIIPITTTWEDGVANPLPNNTIQFKTNTVTSSPSLGGSDSALYVNPALGNDLYWKRGRSDLPFATLGAAVIQATNNDLIKLSPGTFTLSANVILPLGVKLVGSGKRVSTINGVAGFSVQVTGTNSTLRDFSINAGELYIGNSTGSLLATNVLLYNVEVTKGVSDALFLSGWDALTAVDCYFQGDYDSYADSQFAVRPNYTNAAGTFINCQFDSISTGNGNPIHAAALGESKVRFVNCLFRAINGTNECKAITTSVNFGANFGRTTLYGCTFDYSTTNGTAYAIYNNRTNNITVDNLTVPAGDVFDPGSAVKFLQVDGSIVTNLNASSLASGTIPVARFSTTSRVVAGGTGTLTAGKATVSSAFANITNAITVTAYSTNILDSCSVSNIIADTSFQVIGANAGSTNRFFYMIYKP